MKICGCNSCRKNGEIDPHELFELYLENRAIQEEKEFISLLSTTFSAPELNDNEAAFSNSSVAKRINQYTDTFEAHNYWLRYGGSLNGFQQLMEDV